MSKAMQDRVVVVGETVQDAFEHMKSLGLVGAVLVVSSAHRLTIAGGTAGMHMLTVHVSPRAWLGERYADVEKALEDALLRNPNLDVIYADREAA